LDGRSDAARDHASVRGLVRPALPAIPARAALAARSRGHGIADVEGTLSTLQATATALPLLAQPYVATPLGFAIGVALVLVSRASSRLITPDDPQLGMMRVVVAMFLRLGVVVALLAAYYFWAPAGLTYFGISLVVGFMGALTYELFTVGRSTPAAREGGR
jgi:hypothetical protein